MRLGPHITTSNLLDGVLGLEAERLYPIALEEAPQRLQDAVEGVLSSIEEPFIVEPEGANSRAVWVNVNESLQGSISRASIINYLNAMVDEALLTYTETTGKGGHQRVYYMKHGETELKQHIATLIISKLLKEYPQETRKAISENR